MNHFKNLDRKEKIDLIKRIQAGEANIINGEIIERGVILFKKDVRCFSDDERSEIEDCLGENDGNSVHLQYFLNGKPVEYEDIIKKVDAVIILPVKEGDVI